MNGSFSQVQILMQLANPKDFHSWAIRVDCEGLIEPVQDCINSKLVCLQLGRSLKCMKKKSRAAITCRMYESEENISVDRSVGETIVKVPRRWLLWSGTVQDPVPWNYANIPS